MPHLKRDRLPEPKRRELTKKEVVARQKAGERLARRISRRKAS